MGTIDAKNRDAADLVVVGGGAAGMAAAITGAARGLVVRLIESEPQLGGTTAISAGSLWVPGSHHAPPGADSHDAAVRYLDTTVGRHSPACLREAFLRRGPEMVRFLEERSELSFHAYPHLPDYYAWQDGATLTGRALGTVPYDARQNTAALALVRLPLPEFTILGGMMVDRTDIAHLLGAARSLASARHAAGIVLRHAVDRITEGRGTRLVMGAALAVRLAASLLKLGVTIETSTRVEKLVVQSGRVTGVAIAGGRMVAARKGIVLATGGISHDAELRTTRFPAPVAQYSAVPSSNAGGGVRLGLAVGGRLGTGEANAAFWAPASVRRRADGSTAVFPHFVMDRGKPGLIAVGSDGRRFVDEATSYQLFVEAMYRRPDLTVPCWFICDRQFLKRYGLGMVHPRKRRLGPLIRDGYLKAGDTIEALGVRLGVDPAGLATSVARNNRFASAGVDEEFGKGGNAFDRNLGDAGHRPNPCIGPISTPPYYAVQIHPADIGTAVGLVTDGEARVLGADDAPIPGLYAAGNDMHSVWGGVYPGPGATIGPALTFGYAAADHAASAPPEG